MYTVTVAVSAKLEAVVFTVVPTFHNDIMINLIFIDNNCQRFWDKLRTDRPTGTVEPTECCPGTFSRIRNKTYERSLTEIHVLHDIDEVVLVNVYEKKNYNNNFFDRSSRLNQNPFG